MRKNLIFCLALLAAVMLIPNAYAVDFYVTTNGTGTGTGWGDPTSLTNALAKANTSNVIWVAEGTYTDVSTFTITTNGLQIYGGFQEGETVFTNRDLAANETRLDGDGSKCVLDIQADNVLLDGFVITNGYESTTRGAGLRVDGSVGLTMLNSTVVSNTLARDDYGGGAYFNNAGTVLLSNCVFRANRSTARGNGVGFSTHGTTLKLFDCEVSENYTVQYDQRKGKGFYLASGTLIMVGTIVADNYTLSTDGNSGRGTGGYIAGGTASFTNCVFSGNQSPNNSCPDGGGGLYIAGGTVTIESCTFADNLVKTNSTATGGAIYMGNGTVTIKNSIFWGNEAGTGSSAGDTIYQNSGTLNISYSCFDGTGLPRMRFVNGTWGDGIITNDPLFAAEYTDLHLKSKVGRWNGTGWTNDTVNSPCIDAGDPASDYSNEPSGTNGAVINMGAYGNTWQASKSLDQAPAVVTLAPRVVSTAAELKGMLTTGAVSTITFYYGSVNQTTNAALWESTNVLSAGQPVSNIFSSVAGGLNASTEYWFNVYATNAFGEAWGESTNFTSLAAAPGGGAGVIHVDADAIGAADGLSWTNAFTTLEDALTAADEGLGTSIWIADGTYQSMAAHVIQTNGLAVYGGFAGTETLLTQRDWSNNVVLLDGDGLRGVLNIEADDVLLDGLVITNGLKVSGDSTVYGGSGVTMSDGSQNLTMLNCRVVDNLIVPGNNCRGVGVYLNNAGNVLLSNTVVQANHTAQRGYGVGIRSDGTTLTMVDCEISGNYDSGGDIKDGKGFYLGSGTLIMVGTTVSDNYANGTDSNSGRGCGGHINSGTASFTNCVFTGNRSPNNTAGDGGGLYIVDGNVTIENCTFVSNTVYTSGSAAEGGAIYMLNGTVNIKNSIFWGNEAGNAGSAGDTIYQNAGTLNVSYSCFDGTTDPRLHFVGGSWGDGIITNDPLFAAEYTDLHLKSTVGRWNGSIWTNDAVNSPCIDSGDPASDYSNEPPGENGARVNMGAYGNTLRASKSLNAAPVVETQAARVVATAAELKGMLSSGADSTVTFYYGLSDKGTNAVGWDATNVLSELASVSNVFSSVAGSLQASQIYWYRAYATNAFGESWGDAVSFTNGTPAVGGGAGVIHVDADAGGVPDGTSWTNAFTTFENALDAAVAGQGTNIWIAEGAYVGLAAFVIQTNGLSVYGGFSGTETALAQRDWASHDTLIDGDGAGRVLDIQANNVLLDGLIMTNGYLVTGNGAGMLVDSYTNLTMLNCSVVDNTLNINGGYGAGIYFKNAGTVLLSNCVIRANEGTLRVRGGGFRSDNTILTLVDCEVRENYDSNGDQYPGKGFYTGGAGGSLTMVRTKVVGNYYNSTDEGSNGQGGGGFIDGDAFFTNCVFAGNIILRNDGGGLYINNGNVTIENCTFAGNTGDTSRAECEGGAIYQAGGTVTIKNSIFWGNRAGTNAAAGDTIYQAGGTMTNSYSCLEGTNAPHLVGASITLNAGIITDDPLFAVEFSDLHLKSSAGRWNGSKWVTDDVMSPCIDAGDPASDESLEPDGERINMGAYGNTREASRLLPQASVIIVR